MDAQARPAVERLPRPRLLACDIDGTLLDDEGILRQEVRDAIAMVAASGVAVIFATGRSPWTGVAQLADELGLSGPQVTMQGALISVPGTDVIHRVHILPHDIYTEALRFADAHGLDPIVSLVDGHRAGLRPGRDAFGRTAVDGPTFRRVADLEAVARERPVRVYLPTPDRHEAIKAEAVAQFGERASIVWSDGTGIEFLAPGTHKGAGVAWLAATRGIGMDEVAAVGDAANDRELLLMAGRSAAMGVATPDVAACADIVVPPSSESGVLDAIAWFFPDLAELLLAEPAA
jgi:Cof subfamily protein (haloacid dehalogenase superfamily)